MRPCAAFSEKGYDTAGYPAHIEDYNGNTTTFVYDAARAWRRIVLRRTGSPVERAISRTPWHAAYRLPQESTETQPHHIVHA